MQKSLRYRLGIDLGTTSIGTALIELDGPQEQPRPKQILHMGVRIFEDGRDPKTKTPLAVKRREARQARKNQDRYLRRRRRLTEALVNFGLWPKEEIQRKALCNINPYLIRVKALNEKVSLAELGRAIFHLNQRRGFKSNRKSAGGEDGKIRQAVEKLKAYFEANKCRTLGEFYQKERLEKGLSVRARLDGNGAKAAYLFYPSREMIASEFDQIWDKQSSFYPKELSDEAKAKIKDVLLYQRPLKPVIPGKCPLEMQLGHVANRAPIASPYFQRFRLLQQVNELRIINRAGESRPLTLEERNLLLNELLKHKEIKLITIKKLLHLANMDHLSLQTEGRDKMQGDQIGALLSNKKYFGANWFKLKIENQAEIIKALLEIENTEQVISTLMVFGLSHENAAQLAEETLPSGYGGLSIEAMGKIIPYLEEEVITYAEAAKRAGYHHSQLYDGTIYSKLPYYGQVLESRVIGGSALPTDSDERRYGKIANPTVHIALNQLRRVINCCIKHFGQPEQIVIEVARDLKMSEDDAKDYQKRQNENRIRNERINAELIKAEVPVNGENRERYKLWEELASDPMERRCPYTGNPISLSNLFSDEVEIEHILPFAKTYDDSLANKTLAMRYANRIKGNRSPHEAFSSNSYQGILPYQKMLDDLPQDKCWDNKRWRFEADAMERFNENGDFQARQLTDTAYASKIALEYLCYICPKNQVWAIPGRLTSILRSKWGLNEILGQKQENGEFKKNRNHHGHHAIDALVVALTDRSTLQRMSILAAQNLENDRRLLANFSAPITDLQDQARDRLSHLVVSHRKDHGLGGELHNATAYGIVGDFQPKGITRVRHRIPLSSLTQKDIPSVENPALKAALEPIEKIKSAEFKDALAKFIEQTGIRHIRIVENLSVIPIRNRQGDIYKTFLPGKNYCYDIWADGIKWDGKVLSRYEANVMGLDVPKNIIMRLHNNDTIALSLNNESQLMRIIKITEGKITLAPLTEAGNLKERNADENDSFKYLTKSPNALKAMQAHLVHVDECGFVYDRGYAEN